MSANYSMLRIFRVNPIVLFLVGVVVIIAAYFGSNTLKYPLFGYVLGIIIILIAVFRAITEFLLPKITGKH